MRVSKQMIAPYSGLSTSSWPYEESVRDITCIVSLAQKRRGLHYDGEADNFFHIPSLPSTCPDTDTTKKTVLFAVQIGNFAVPLESDCYVTIPKGKFR